MQWKESWGMRKRKNGRRGAVGKKGGGEGTEREERCTGEEREWGFGKGQKGRRDAVGREWRERNGSGGLHRTAYSKADVQ